MDNAFKNIQTSTKDSIIIRELEEIYSFGKESARYFHNTLLRCGRFKDELKEFFIDMKDYGVNAFENLENGIDFLKEHIRIRGCHYLNLDYCRVILKLSFTDK